MHWNLKFQVWANISEPNIDRYTYKYKYTTIENLGEIARSFHQIFLYPPSNANKLRKSLQILDVASQVNLADKSNHSPRQDEEDEDEEDERDEDNMADPRIAKEGAESKQDYVFNLGWLKLTVILPHLYKSHESLVAVRTQKNPKDKSWNSKKQSESAFFKCARDIVWYCLKIIQSWRILLEEDSPRFVQIHCEFIPWLHCRIAYNPINCVFVCVCPPGKFGLFQTIANASTSSLWLFLFFLLLFW